MISSLTEGQNHMFIFKHSPLGSETRLKRYEAVTNEQKAMPFFTALVVSDNESSETDSRRSPFQNP